MYLITPLRLKFRYQASKHIGELGERLKGGVFDDCTGTFPAKITTDAEQGLRDIRRNVRRHLNLCWFIGDGRGLAQLGDFELVYSKSQTNKEGFLWSRNGESTCNLEPTNGELFIDEVRWLMANLDTANVTKDRAREATSQVKQLMKRFGIEETGQIKVVMLPDKSGYDLDIQNPAAAHIG